MLLKSFLVEVRTCVRSLSQKNTIDKNELQHFKQFSKEWWDEVGPLRGLHNMNKLRVPLIRDGLLSTNSEVGNSPAPLKGFSILDVGCGGGILTEPLARLGSDVTGLDANTDIIEKARLHSEIEHLPNIEYVCSSVEEFANKNVEKYDAVVASEVLEHVTEKKDFLRACLKCIKPGGSVFLTTMNQTFLANFIGILLAENFDILPKGTHDYNKFIKPHNLQRMLEEENCKTLLLHGMFYNFVTHEWSWCNDYSINYALHAVKHPAEV